MKNILTATKADIKQARKFLATKDEPRDYLKYAHCLGNKLYFCDGFGLLVMNAPHLVDGYYNISADGSASFNENFTEEYPNIASMVADIDAGTERPLVVKDSRSLSIPGWGNAKTVSIDDQIVRELLWSRIKNLNPVLKGKVKEVKSNISGLCDLGYFVLMGVSQNQENSE